MDDDLRKLAGELEREGALSIGSLYHWPRSSGGYLDVYGFGMMTTPHGVKFVSAHNSVKKGGMKFTLLDPELPLKMIASGDVKYVGNILDPNYRKKHLDWEKTSLAICGFMAAFQTIKMQKQISVEEILMDMDSGKLTLDDLIKNAKMESGLAPEDFNGISNLT